jgi:ABC-2 type transport system permease protein
MAFCFVVGWLGEVLDFPDWVTRLSPYSHVPLVPAQPMQWDTPAWLLLVAVALVTLGAAKLANRDIG